MRILIVFLLSLVCCGIEPEIKEVCAQRHGTYSVTWAERDGTCGHIPEQIVSIQSQPKDPSDVDPECTGWIDYTADNCQVLPNVTCPSSNGSIKETGAVDWSLDGSTASGVIQLVERDLSGTFVCLSTYDIVYHKISKF